MGSKLSDVLSKIAAMDTPIGLILGLIELPDNLSELKKRYSGKEKAALSKCFAKCLTDNNADANTLLFFKEFRSISGDCITDNMFENSIGIVSVEIPNGVTSIGKTAFSNCVNMEYVIIPSSVTSVGQDAFKNCSSLNAVHIFDLRAWCSITFSSSTSNPLTFAHNLYLFGNLVTDMTIPNSVTEIRFGAFNGCTSLTSVTIPTSVESIQTCVFSYCSNLSSLKVDVNNRVYYSINNCIIARNSGTVVAATNYSKLPSDGSITSIGAYSFCGCKKMTSIVIPYGVTQIGEGAFIECDSLTSVSLPQGLKRIDYVGFFMCSALPSISIPNTVTNLGSYAFAWCFNLTKINIPYGVIIIDPSCFRKCSRLKSVVISESVNMIGSEVFDECDKLTSLSFSDINGWWVTSLVDNWRNKTGGNNIDVSDPKENASLFRYRFAKQYWYKK